MNISDLHLQSQHISVDAHSLLQVIEQGHRDTIIIKILTQIAMVFLPASLIAISLLSQYEDREPR